MFDAPTISALGHYHGRFLDPACESGGMFVSSARFVSESRKYPAPTLAIHGVEKTDEAGTFCRLNLDSHSGKHFVDRTRF
ncbi:MAG: N-6 DNA methylase [Limisphaerales bacterium]